MTDVIETVGRSLVMHGPAADRAYLMALHPSDSSEIVDRLAQLASSRGYSAVFAKVPAREVSRFVSAGYHMEAVMLDFLPEGGSVCFMAQYFCAERRIERQPLLVRQVLEAAGTQQNAAAAPLPASFSVRMATEDDAAKIAACAKKGSHLPESVRTSVKKGATFFGIWNDERMVALSSAEIDPRSSSAELHDFVVLPDCREQGLVIHLLQQMEKYLLNLHIRSVFTVTRASSHRMNRIFSGNGYRFGGTITNCTRIDGRLESGNVWHKALPEDPNLAWRKCRSIPAPAA